MKRLLALTVALSAACGSSPAPLADSALERARPEAGPRAEAGARERRGPGADSLRGPPFPHVLAHGFFGFASSGSVEYFHEVKAALAAAGHQVFVTRVDPFNSSVLRGEQLLAQVQKVLADTGAAKVNLIGHSQGGLDARYVATRIPGRVAAVVSFATPHRGSAVADALLLVGPGYSLALLDAFCALVGRPLWGELAKDPELKASLDQLSSAGAKSFNAAFPDAPGVAYYSLGGRSSLSLGGALCEVPDAPPFIASLAQVRDPIDPAMLLTAQVLAGSLTDPAPNDGLVAVESMVWGKWLGCVPADHLDEIGQLLGDHPGLGNSFDHLALYRELAGYLVARGH